MCLHLTNVQNSLGTFFNAAVLSGKQEEVEQWVQQQYPNVWTELEKVGIVTTEEGLKRAKIDTKVRP